MSTRFAAIAALYLALSGLMGLLLVWLLTSPGSAWDPNDSAVMREARVFLQAMGYERQRPFALCGLGAIILLPVIFATWLHARKPQQGNVGVAGAARRAAVLAIAGYLLFRAAIVVLLVTVPFRLSILAQWQLFFYEILVLAYMLAFIPTAALGFAIVHRAGLDRAAA